ncbi:DUF4144 domain-containing protein [Methylobacillus gramineus]|uniref:DUF4144 domain-containing protein n=1 Tax=Methylobacillus gramineus TaxID=755169 RepID=UPI001CFF5FB2|nr:DUF4144 domain-containing protein [Methylobacillus gramineus]MCB5184955.1 DUF4144 domain-containing protein [Methylobacillus gramineus]
MDHHDQPRHNSGKLRQDIHKLMHDDTIHWPAIIQHAGDDELDYIADQQSWNAWPPSQGDARFIDSAGRVYVITGPRQLKLKNTRLSLNEILTLVRAHAMLEGLCCTTKIGAANIQDAISLIPSMERS